MELGEHSLGFEISHRENSRKIVASFLHYLPIQFKMAAAFFLTHAEQPPLRKRLHESRVSSKALDIFGLRPITRIGNPRAACFIGTAFDISRKMPLGLPQMAVITDHR